ncbi:MAG: hypothetical protein ACXWWA_10960, partial [Chitinophagaceae bacterium]
MIWEMLPEICETSEDKTLTLWAIREANTFLDLLFGEYKFRGENIFSVNPYIFLETQHYN